MVEGPGATRNARKLQSVVGCRVESILVGSPLKDDFQGAIVQQAFCVGKQVFVVFDNDAALLFHFGMNGCLWVHNNNNNNDTTIRQRRTDLYRKDAPMFVVRLVSTALSNVKTTWEVTCRGTTVKQVSATVATSRRQRLAALDVCADDNVFSMTCVVAALQTRPTGVDCGCATRSRQISWRGKYHQGGRLASCAHLIHNAPL